MWGLLQCNYLWDIWILSLLNLANLCCWVYLGFWNGHVVVLGTFEF
jgi:hypothetical protein